MCVTLTCFLDGAFVCSTVISNNTAAAGVGFYTQLPSGGEAASLDVEYVKIANSFEDVPTPPETPENPGNDNDDQPQAPDTGIVMIPVVASALVFCTAKKRH